MYTFLSSGKYGFSVKFSPLRPNCLAVSTSDNYGISGKGSLFVLTVKPGIGIEETQIRHWHDGLFDVAWSESNPNHIITGGANGLLQLWDLNIKNQPAIVLSEHQSDISSVNWSKHNFNQIVTSSWDSNVKLWDLTRKHSLSTFFGSTNIIAHSVIFSKRSQDLFASVYEDGYLRIWNASMNKPVLICKVQDSPALTCDWSLNNDYMIATGGSDGFIRGWDIRNFFQPIFQLKDSEQATKKLLFSPHYPNIFATVSFDFTTKIWDIYEYRSALEVTKAHSNLVYGLDWNQYEKGQICDCSWDKTVCIFVPKCLSHLKHKI